MSISLLQVINDVQTLGGRVNSLASSLANTISNNNDQVVAICDATQKDLDMLIDVMDSFIRLVLDDGSATEEEKERLVAHLNAFLNRYQKPY